MIPTDQWESIGRTFYINFFVLETGFHAVETKNIHEDYERPQ